MDQKSDCLRLFAPWTLSIIWYCTSNKRNKNK